jgi:DNA polymerase III delta prime subunit
VDDYRQKKMALGEVYALAQHARLLFDLGRTADATAAATRERALAEQIGSVHVREEIAATLALERAARGDVRGAIADLEAAIARSERARFIDTNLQQRLVLARLERMRGHRGASRRILSDLEADARRRGYGALARETQALRRANSSISRARSTRK